MIIQQYFFHLQMTSSEKQLINKERKVLLHARVDGDNSAVLASLPRHQGRWQPSLVIIMYLQTDSEDVKGRRRSRERAHTRKAGLVRHLSFKTLHTVWRNLQV